MKNWIYQIGIITINGLRWKRVFISYYSYEISCFLIFFDRWKSKHIHNSGIISYSYKKCCELSKIINLWYITYSMLISLLWWYQKSWIERIYTYSKYCDGRKKTHLQTMKDWKAFQRLNALITQNGTLNVSLR